MTIAELNPKEIQIYETYAKLNLPRHTSYPTALNWRDHLTDRQLATTLSQYSNEKQSWSLYFHIPFCRSLCYYCGCNKEIRPLRDEKTLLRIEQLLTGLEAELFYKASLSPDRRVHHIHFGGGTPSYLNRAEWERLWRRIHQHFQIDKQAELAIELDPRTIGKDELKIYRDFGFNRISLGVQDFDPKVQKAVNRFQSFEQVRQLTEEARELGFHSVNYDLIYGLPFQTLESMTRTLEQVIKLAPDRIAYYRLAVMPEIFKWQKSFIKADLPQGRESLQLQLKAIAMLSTAGYQFIGLDHFAKPEDELSKALVQKTLSRNFQGMTAGHDRALLGFGPSAISSTDKLYWQNTKDFNSWYRQQTGEMERQWKSCFLSPDDIVRKQIIEHLYCHGEADLNALASQLAEPVEAYFEADLQRLQKLIQDGLASYKDGIVREQSTLGRLLRRVVASSFDAYLDEEVFSKGLQSNQASQVG